jgi:hypothetical protein
MNRQEFQTLLDNLSFDEPIKQLMLTSYMAGYDKGKIDGLTDAIAIARSTYHEPSKLIQ